MKGRTGRPWRRFVQRVKETYPPICHLCGEFIDLTLHHNDDRAYTVDHVIPLAMGGNPEDLANARPAHRWCNSKKGADMNYTHERPKQSRVW